MYVSWCDDVAVAEVIHLRMRDLVITWALFAMRSSVMVLRWQIQAESEVDVGMPHRAILTCVSGMITLPYISGHEAEAFQPFEHRTNKWKP